MNTRFACAAAVLLIAFGSAGPALADEILLTVEGRQGAFPGDEAGSPTMLAVGADYEVAVPSAGGGGGLPTGRRQHKQFVVRKTVGAASPWLFEALVTGERLRKVTVQFKKKGKGKGEQQEYLIVTMTDVLVSSYQVGGSSAGDAVPLESVSFSFARIEMSHPTSGKQVVDAALGGH